MASMEELLTDSQTQASAALKAAGQVQSQLKKVVAAASTGQVRDLRKATAAAVTTCTSLAEQLDALQASYDLDEEAHLAGGGYLKELLAAAKDIGLTIVSDDDRLLSYPSIVRLIPADAAVEIDKVRERRIRPSVLAAHLLAVQQRPPRFKAEAFLESMRRAYDHVVALAEQEPGAVVRLVDVWSVLTLLPGQAKDYSKQEFARDLYLLDQSGVTSAGKDQRVLRFAASTGTKGAGVLTTVARTGQQQVYWGVAFA